MRAFRFFGAIFGVIGFIALGVMCLSAYNTYNFVNSAVTTTGKVVKIIKKTSTDSHNNRSVTRLPVVLFTDKNGKSYRFKSSVSSESSIVNDSIKVMYIPNKPSNARIADSASDVWSTTLIAAAFGFIFSIIGWGIFYAGMREILQEWRSKKYTRVIEAEIVDVSRNSSISVNNCSPYQINAQWFDSDSNQVYVFASKNLWFDPLPFLGERTVVSVRVDDYNLKKYWMDVSFLPKKA